VSPCFAAFLGRAEGVVEGASAAVGVASAQFESLLDFFLEPDKATMQPQAFFGHLLAFAHDFDAAKAKVAASARAGARAEARAADRAAAEAKAKAKAETNAETNARGADHSRPEGQEVEGGAGEGAGAPGLAAAPPEAALKKVLRRPRHGASGESSAPSQLPAASQSLQDLVAAQATWMEKRA
jgi:hypothetical protein